MVNKNVAYVSFLLLSLLSLGNLFSQPANDDICNVQMLVVDQPCTSPNGDNTGATEQPGEPEPACFSGGVNSVWFSFVAPPSGRVTITTNFPGVGTNTDTEIALYSLPGGNCNILSNLMEVDCHQDVDVNNQNYLSTLLAAPVTPGQTYYIQVSGWGGAEGSFCLEVNSYKIFVDKDATGVGDGSNWANAFTEISTALTIVDLAALDNVEIWVAEGVYKPTLTNDRDASFTLKRGVKLIGGFEGTEASPDQRISDNRGLFLTNESKLSGDIGALGNNSDNSYSVVQFDNSQSDPITLDGFSIVEGNANVGTAGFDQNPSPRGGGGAIYMVGRPASDTIRGCIMADNNAFRGGVIYIKQNSPVLDQCAFFGNDASDLGGAIYAFDASPSFSKVIFGFNEARFSGGGFFSRFSSSTFTECLFQLNEGASEGGAVYAGGSGSLSFSNCEFDRNEAGSGGAINFLSVNATLSNCTFNENKVSEVNITGQGGAIRSSSSLIKIEGSDFIRNRARDGAALFIDSSIGIDTIFNNTFEFNTANKNGGGILVENSSSRIDSCVFEDNRSDLGGGIYFLRGNPELINSQFVDNSAVTHGGGIYIDVSSPPIEACTFFGNNAGGDGGGLWSKFSNSSITNSTFSENHCDFLGGAVYGSFGNLSFVNCDFEKNIANPFGRGTGRGGAVAYVTGNPTIDSCTFKENISAQFGGAIYTGSSSIDISFTEFDENFASRGGSLFFSGTRSKLDSCIFNRNRAIVGGGAIFNDGSDPEFSKCSFKNNQAGSAIGATGFGGAMANQASSSPTINYCLFEGNDSNSGGAIHNERFSNPIIKNSRFIENIAGDAAGAILNTPQSLPKVDSCTFISNRTIASGSRGGAIWNWSSDAVFSYCTFKENKAESFGGSFYNTEGSPNIRFCTFSKDSAREGGSLYSRFSEGLLIANSSFEVNYASTAGGAIRNFAGELKLINNTFSSNQAGFGGAISNSTHPNPIEIYGSTFYNNQANVDGGGIYLFRSGINIKNTIIAGNKRGNGTNSDILNRTDQAEAIPTTSLGHNLIGDTTSAWISNLDTDILGSNLNPINPMLDTLGFYGGPSLVHPPLAGSLLRGAGEPIESTDLLTDQRGFSRKIGSRDGNIDIGAFEAQSSFISPIARAVCVEEPEFLPLQTILVQDSTGGAFENGENLSLEYAAPDGIEFQAGMGTINCIGNGLSDCNIDVSPDLITITYTRTYDTLLNSIEIRDIFIKAESGTSPTFAELTRTGGNALQYDNEVGDAVKLASLSILPTVKLADLPYDDSFESDQSFWIPSSDSSIWEEGSPEGEVIDRAASGQNAWMTDLDAPYSVLDTSWVASSCFDFRGLSNPLLSVSIWSDTESGFDGTVFQQSLDGGDSWQTVGTNERGINWYNSATISANPGKQTTEEEYGWTGRDTAWKRAFVKLDQVDNQDAVRFRFAFASIGQLDETQTNNGFAFDDFFIGESDNRVLMEHFTDNSTARNTDNTEVQNLVSSFSPNIIPIQYHVSSGDEFYERNKAGPRVRALYYGVSEAGNAVVNGNEFLGLSRELDAGVLERSLLKTSSISVSIDTLEDEAINILPSRDIPEEVVLYVAIVENTEDQKSVFRAFLPNAGGTDIDDPQAGVFQAFNISWDESTSASTSILDNYDSLEVVVFVQNRETKEVYQSISSPIWSGLLERNALREGLFKDPEAKLSFYPNPVREYIFLDFGKINQERFQLSISDLQGKSVFQQLIKPGLSLYELNLKQLSKGMYFLHLTKEGERVRKVKIILR